MSRQGFLRVRVDGEILDLKPGMQIDRYKTHDIELVIDRFIVKDNDEFKKRLEESIKTAMYYGDGTVLIFDLESFCYTLRLNIFWQQENFFKLAIYFSPANKLGKLQVASIWP